MHSFRLSLEDDYRSEICQLARLVGTFCTLLQHKGRSEADLRRIDLQFADGAAQRIAVHAELCCGLALVAAMMREHLKQITAFELAHGLVVGNAGAVHLGHYAFKLSFPFASQVG